MKIIPLAFDSFGVRGMATFVESDVKILIDPGAALGPRRYGLPPHRIEIETLERLKRTIIGHASEADILTISHYHYDHYMPEENIYTNKILLIKHPEKKINRSQFMRARSFIEFIDNMPERIEFADGKIFRFNGTTIKFSHPVFHGTNSRLGYVIMLSIKYGNKKLIHASDVQGPQADDAKEWIIKENPDTLIISGFPTLFLGWRFETRLFEKSKRNLMEIIEKSNVKEIMLEHHLVRDIHYKEKMTEVFEIARKMGKNIVTAAEFIGMENNFLEARRKELYAPS